MNAIKIGENKFIVNEYTVEQFDKVLGKLLTQIDALGLPEKQEKANKDIIRQIIWNMWENPWGTEVKESLFENPIVKE